MPIVFAVIGGLIMGAIGNPATGIISAVVLFFLIGAYEEQERLVKVLKEKIHGLEVELDAIRKEN